MAGNDSEQRRAALPRNQWSQLWAQRIVLRRLTAGAPQDYVLRGGVLTNYWLGGTGRPPRDLDLIATQRFDERAAIRQITDSLSNPPFDDGATIHCSRIGHEIIWAETDTPGLRITAVIEAASTSVQQMMDVGYHDPIVPPPELIQLPLHEGPPLTVWAARRETGFAWKFHELFEKGNWESKHLYDLWAMLRCCQFHPDDLIGAIRMAFESRRTPLNRIERLISGDFGQSPSRQKRWPKFCEKYPQLEIPRDLNQLVGELRDFIAPVRNRLY